MLHNSQNMINILQEEKECSTITFNLKAVLSPNDLWQLWEKYNFQIVKIRSSPQRVSLWNGVLQVYSKFTGEHWCESFFLIKLYSNFIEITDTSAWVFSCKVAVCLQNIICLWGASSKEYSYLLQIMESWLSYRHFADKFWKKSFAVGFYQVFHIYKL